MLLQDQHAMQLLRYNPHMKLTLYVLSLEDLSLTLDIIWVPARYPEGLRILWGTILCIHLVALLRSNDWRGMTWEFCSNCEVGLLLVYRVTRRSKLLPSYSFLIFWTRLIMTYRFLNPNWWFGIIYYFSWIGLRRFRNSFDMTRINRYLLVWHTVKPRLRSKS